MNMLFGEFLREIKQIRSEIKKMRDVRLFGKDDIKTNNEKIKVSNILRGRPVNITI